MRDVWIVPGGGGKEMLCQALHGHSLSITNPFSTKVHVEIESSVPRFFAKDWEVSMSESDRSFDLDPHKPGEMPRDVSFSLEAGKAFKRAEIAAYGFDSKIELKVWADGQLIGGRTYWIDPNLTNPL